jgi:RimJ/RimL family protein N-acetyltransferase
LAARADARLRLGLGPLISMIDPANSRSLALARRLGATFQRAHEEEPGRTCHIYRHTLPEGLQ